MAKNQVYVLFGNNRSIKNYLFSPNYLVEKTPSLDYIVCCFGLSNFRDSKDFQKHLDGYQEFLFISKHEFEFIYHDLCSKARSFMKTRI